jgi:two-component system LytT family response regulator
MSNKTIKTVIVDDEPSAREGLELMLSHDADIELAGICNNGIEAIQFLKEKQVDLILLDIHMPGIDGFDVLDNIAPEKWPFVVFITAFDDYAVKAFEYHALDYILKPFSDERFFQMLGRVKQSIFSNRTLEQTKKYEELKNDLNRGKPMKMDFFYDDENPGAQNLVIKDSSKIVIIPAAKITYIEAFDYYIKIHYEGQFKLTRIPIKNIIPRLPKDQFIRVHRSYVINMNHIDQLEKRGKGETVAILRSGQEIRVSDTYKKELLKRIQAPEN